MRRKLYSEDLKYNVRRRYFARCTETGTPVSFSTFYETVAKSSGSHPSRIQRLVTCRRDSSLIATMKELEAFAQQLDCSAAELASEAGERVVAG